MRPSPVWVYLPRSPTVCADYRRIPRALSHVYYSPLDHSTRAEVRKLFGSLTAGQSVVRDRELHTWGRSIVVPESTEQIAQFKFEDLCGNKHPLSAADYLEVTRTFGTIFLMEVPKMDLGMKDLVSLHSPFLDRDGVLMEEVRHGGLLHSLTLATRARYSKVNLAFFFTYAETSASARISSSSARRCPSSRFSPTPMNKARGRPTTCGA